jgi:N-acetylmuramoyl-L-alanine amidase
MNGRGLLRNALPSTSRPRAVRLGVSPHLPLLAFLLAVSTSIPSRGVAETELRQARLGVTSARTRLVLELGSSAYTHLYSVAGDTSLVLRLTGVKRATAFGAPAGPEGLFRSLRMRQEGRDGLEVRVLFTAPATARVFRVGAEAGRPPRLVVDLVAKPRARPAASPKPPDPPALVRPSVQPAGAGTGDDAAPAAGDEAEPTSRDEAAPAAGDEAPTRSPSSSEIAAPDEEPSASAVVPGPGTPGELGRAGISSGSRHSGPRVVVLDPGHGGKDPGALGKGLREKDVCLDVARRLAAALNKAPGYRAVITRQDDRRVSLAQRMLFAEQQGADLFVSIHVNAARSSRASGAEVFFLSIGAATDRAAAELARLENEADPEFVVKEDEALKGLPFAVDLRQSDTLLRSSRIAEVVLDALSTRGLAEARGVKQAGFAVLKSFQVPSILVEVGFISSQLERKKLKSPDHREKLAEALAAGVRRYFDHFAPARPGP